MSHMREVAFVIVLLAAAAAVTFGVAQIYEPAAWIVAGGLAAAIGWLVLSE